MAHAFIDALQRQFPHASRGEGSWCYQFALGAAAAPPERRARRAALSRGECQVGDRRRPRRLVAFIVGGMRAALPPAATSARSTSGTTDREGDLDHITRRTVLSGLAAASGACLYRAQPGADEIVFGFTAVEDFASLFITAEGYFMANLDVELKFIPLNSTIPRRYSPIRCRSAGRRRRCSCRRSTAGSIWSSPAAALTLEGDHGLASSRAGLRASRRRRTGRQGSAFPARRLPCT